MEACRSGMSIYHKDPGWLGLSPGHAAPILYAAWAEAGLFSVDDLLNLRKVDSDLEGHPTPRLSFVDIATGSLGQGLSCAAGMAYVGKYIDKLNYRVHCIVGDGESAEGSIWEALAFSSHYKLDNLVVIFDVNRLGQSEPTPLQHRVDTYKARLEAFGFNTYIVDGHSISEVCKRFEEAKSVTGFPTAIIAKTLKGKKFPDIEDKENWHGKPLGTKGTEIIKLLQDELMKKGMDRKPAIVEPEKEISALTFGDIKLAEEPNYVYSEKLLKLLQWTGSEVMNDLSRRYLIQNKRVNGLYQSKRDRKISVRRWKRILSLEKHIFS
ncbi:Transketolase-like protein 2 [Araneus ventricosus]|uniref:Transketolase-like protein 2 n=1 Tax=Araneus ventricosus TaxID=182803 RepID=A0A4Y2U4E5_ARAVE|nr:Transketolase-like protein 2 [Araneus ventricosus]